MGERIAVLLPCYNEALTIEKVVADFKRELPDAVVYVYDNNSTDGSCEIAERAGAVVRHVMQQGKGHVVRRMFQEIEANVYVMVDSDDTYPAEAVHELIKPVTDGVADMVCGDRLSSTYMTENKRPGHNFGNVLVCALVKRLWSQKVYDVMTGYRVFSRRFVKTCPVLSNGFEIETEITLHTLDKRLSLKEIPIQYRDRPKGSFSKLNTIGDGLRVLKTIFNMFRFYRPLAFFSAIGLLSAIFAGVMVIPVFAEYLETGLVPRFPTLICACFALTASLLSFGIALVLDAVKKQSDQAFELTVANVQCDFCRDMPVHVRVPPPPTCASRHPRHAHPPTSDMRISK